VHSSDAEVVSYLQRTLQRSLLVGSEPGAAAAVAAGVWKQKPPESAAAVGGCGIGGGGGGVAWNLGAHVAGGKDGR